MKKHGFGSRVATVFGALALLGLAACGDDGAGHNCEATAAPDVSGILALSNPMVTTSTCSSSGGDPTAIAANFQSAFNAEVRALSQCVGGTKIGQFCDDDGDCPMSTCRECKYEVSQNGSAVTITDCNAHRFQGCVDDNGLTQAQHANFSQELQPVGEINGGSCKVDTTIGLNSNLQAGAGTPVTLGVHYEFEGCTVATAPGVEAALNSCDLTVTGTFH